jgi:hypothetical protein
VSPYHFTQADLMLVIAELELTRRAQAEQIEQLQSALQTATQTVTAPPDA